MSPPVRHTTVANFLKDRTELRVSEDATELLAALLTKAAERIADSAKQLAIDDERNTLLDRDIEAAYATFLQDEGPAFFSFAIIHTAIDGIDNDAFTELLGLLRADLGGGPQ